MIINLFSSLIGFGGFSLFVLTSFYTAALYSLNIERCSISSRTIEKIVDAIDAGSMLSQLWIGTRF